VEEYPIKRKALITGIAGQDGSYLAELLLEKDYEVFGMIPRRSTPQTQTLRIEHLAHRLTLEYGDVLDLASIYRVMNMVKPDEIYHLAAQSHVQISFTEPIHTSSVIAIGTLNMLEATSEFAPQARFYNAASSEIFGNTPDYPITEQSRMIPCSPYAAAKLNAYHLTQIYRVSKRLFAVNGILFNHESPRRGLNFVTAKVVKGALDIKHGKQEQLLLGNLDASRDWGHAADFVRSMWLMLERDEPDDYLVATGREVTIRELCRYVFEKVGLGDYNRYVRTAERYRRPYELKHLRGDSSKARQLLGWEPKYTFEQLLDEMIVDIEQQFYPTPGR
jgi:GDPmannose 4,6-dehydratase